MCVPATPPLRCRNSASDRSGREVFAGNQANTKSFSYDKLPDARGEKDGIAVEEEVRQKEEVKMVPMSIYPPSSSFRRTSALRIETNFARENDLNGVKQGDGHEGFAESSRPSSLREAAPGNILTWTAVQKLNWEVIFLLGGGFALSKVCSPPPLPLMNDSSLFIMSYDSL
jgi:hypothetical protein